MEIRNLNDVEVEVDDDDPPGYHPGYARLGPMLGASMIGMSVFELPPGNAVCPYHFELNNEEWLLCISGAPILRTPDGEQTLRAGDVVCFPEGPAGAHHVRNDGDEPLRVAILSTKREPGVAIYPDSNKLGVFSSELRHMVRLEPSLDYWDGEQTGTV